MSSEYRELRPPPEVAGVVACLWDQTSDGTVAHTVVPDGCVDLIWMGGQLVIDGADTGPRHVEIAASVFGIRLRVGTAGAVLGVPASEVRDLRVTASDLWGEAGAMLHAALAVAPPTRRHQLLSDAVSARRAVPDPLVRAAIACLARPGARVAAVASDVGVSERHLHRRVMEGVGYGPKTVARVLRLRGLMAQPHGPLAELALAAGYANQAHMNAEVRRLTGETPVRFLKDRHLVEDLASTS